MPEHGHYEECVGSGKRCSWEGEEGMESIPSSPSHEHLLPLPTHLDQVEGDTGYRGGPYYGPPLYPLSPST